MKKLILALCFFIGLETLIAQPTNWKTFSATSCKGKTQSIKNVLQDSLKPILLIWEGIDCGFCQEEGDECGASATAYGKVVAYWNAVGRINGNPTCDEAAEWAKKYGNPPTNFVFLDVPAEDNWSQPAPGQGRWYWVISQDKISKDIKMIYSGNIIKDAEVIARRATKDFPTANETAQSTLISAKLFPNPANENINLQIQLKSTASVTAEIVDLAGKSLGEFINGSYQTVDKSIDLSGYAKGMYILKYSVDGLPYSQLFSVK